MTIYALQRRIIDKGITVSSLNPGMIMNWTIKLLVNVLLNTELTCYSDDMWFALAFKPYMSTGMGNCIYSPINT